MAKTAVIVGNWKMYKTGKDAVTFVKQLMPLVEDTKTKVGLAVPFTAISLAAKAAEGSDVLIGAQNMNDASEGAFTGEIAASMLKDAGATFVIIGHSERRKIFGESNEQINAKVIRALDEGMTPVFCVGETEEERESGHEEILESQIIDGLKGVSKDDLSKVIVAYEPVWAIGTGKTATPKIAQDAHLHIRNVLADSFGKTKAAKVVILYGGSVKPENAADLMKQKDIDGALVGGASLNPTTFADIVNFK